MSRIFSLSFVCYAVILYTTCTVDAAVQFRNCKIYFSNEELPELENGDRYCFESKQVLICRESSCPQLSCDNPQPPSLFSNCAFCPGECVHDGNVYSVGERFTHMDGINFCSCSAGNRIACTRMGRTSEHFLCM
ncbi:uncharacterized protein LOC117317127 [Pecten maximus]|uniref:uncharacterized protein LOC117317127 n=1 Tax=Pecten maximus TaxID=6579 RepID=UPI001458C5AC|nr:uncharacterized protein LOC117317127 [Pecten maximus]